MSDSREPESDPPLRKLAADRFKAGDLANEETIRQDPDEAASKGLGVGFAREDSRTVITQTPGHVSISSDPQEDGVSVDPFQARPTQIDVDIGAIGRSNEDADHEQGQRGVTTKTAGEYQSVEDLPPLEERSDTGRAEDDVDDHSPPPSKESGRPIDRGAATAFFILPDESDDELEHMEATDPGVSADPPRNPFARNEFSRNSGTETEIHLIDQGISSEPDVDASSNLPTPMPSLIVAAPPPMGPVTSTPVIAAPAVITTAEPFLSTPVAPVQVPANLSAPLVAPTPQASTAQASTPQAPTAQAPTPQASTPQASTPQAPTPQAPTPQASIESVAVTAQAQNPPSGQAPVDDNVANQGAVTPSSPGGTPPMVAPAGANQAATSAPDEDVHRQSTQLRQLDDEEEPESEEIIDMQRWKVVPTAWTTEVGQKKPSPPAVSPAQVAAPAPRALQTVLWSKGDDDSEVHGEDQDEAPSQRVQSAFHPTDADMGSQAFHLAAAYVEDALAHLDEISEALRGADDDTRRIGQAAVMATGQKLRRAIDMLSQSPADDDSAET